LRLIELAVDRQYQLIESGDRPIRIRIRKSLGAVCQWMRYETGPTPINRQSEEKIPEGAV
jgi:hypothetical protein